MYKYIFESIRQATKTQLFPFCNQVLLQESAEDSLVR